MNDSVTPLVGPVPDDEQPGRIDRWRARAADAGNRYQERAQTQPLLGLPLAFLAQYAARQGVLLASAAAFRLFLWLLPLALLVAGVLAGAGGLMLGTTDTTAWNMGQQVLLIMFASVLLGGLGTAYGAMVGGLFVGIVSDVSTFWLDADLKIVVALGTLVLVLLFRPQGVFGVRTRAA